jgi:imidazole glycerol-phosphate synthase subunit HisH
MSALVAVDMGTSNLASVLNAFRRVGAEVAVTDRSDDIEAAKVILLPGVGAFERAMTALRAKGLCDLLRRRAFAEGTPFFGICLGMQLMAEESEEHGIHAGLGLLRSRVVRLEPGEPGYRVPNIGWSDVRPAREGVLFPNATSRSFYFVHSYHMICTDPADVAATIEYGGRETTVAVERGNLFGCQFHPEKSQDAGLDLIHRFVRRVHDDGRLN